ncbi:HAMP domain-containing histidine kinase [Mycobacterium hodleri]|uniref:sensor histidine kinase n=1 Tax=Mycolicibacterium hodleri TaxID=49897 RepID=UPI0021F3B2E7|nr:HAMP domain-containing sensor histidine kinase [Mycolicibacterium hodleri]MCV7134549.1 HAMP domain-containing histidine kinase [Mycolicibacterium hodleri]
MTAASTTPWWRPRTLSRQLVGGVAVLVTVVTFGTGALSVYSLHTYMTTMSDAEVEHSLAAFEHSYEKVRVGPSGAGGEPLTDFIGQAPGTLIAVMDGDSVVDSAMFSEGDTDETPGPAVNSLQLASWNTDQPQTIELDGLGRYRAVSTEVDDGRRLVSAVSMESANRVVAAKTVAVVVITLVAALLAGVGTVLLVRWALRPLRRVAATAARAAKMPLADEDHRITTRVRQADSDPDNEVGIVGETLNRLLANIDSALAARAMSDRRMRRFLTDASHELRTPLAAIQGYAQLTRQESASLPPTTEYALARIESESRRMTSLVGDMLLLSRLDEGQGLENRRVDLTALVADAVNDAIVSSPDHRWSTDLPVESVWVMGDRARLHQVVSNLLSNARHHTPPGVTVTTALRLVRDEAGEAVQLTVTDDGPGIDATLLPELFERFVRGDRASADQPESTGLGLSIVASVVEAHGGAVSARSGGGSTQFEVRLPPAVVTAG